MKCGNGSPRQRQHGRLIVYYFIPVWKLVLLPVSRCLNVIDNSLVEDQRPTVKVSRQGVVRSASGASSSF
jgi:hypothetical protein